MSTAPEIQSEGRFRMVVATLDFGAKDSEGLQEAMDGTAGPCEDVPGLDGLETRRGVEDQDRSLITARWDSVEAHAAWQKEHAQESLRALGPYSQGPPEIKHHR